jgi:basic membrane protein A
MRALAQGRRVRVGMVTDHGGLGDHSFYDSAHAGLQAAKHRPGVGTVVLQSRSVAGEVARRFPRQRFSIVDAVVDAPNVTSVLFREQEGSFPAGALAALTTRTKTIGFLGGADVPIMQTFAAGYAAGAREIDPSVRVLVKYVGSFDDVAAGKELAGILYAQNADVVYPPRGRRGWERSIKFAAASTRM